MLDVEVIEDPGAAAAALDPIRSRILAELSQPSSATAVAARVGMPRQKVNYHLRALERHGLVRLEGSRRWGGLTERTLVATSATFVISPSALGPVAADPDRMRDRFSAGYLIALAARVVWEVSSLVGKSARLEKRLPTLSIDTEIRFRSAAERAAFSAELVETVRDLASRYHAAAAEKGRPHRLVVMAHPLPHKRPE